MPLWPARPCRPPNMTAFPLLVSTSSTPPVPRPAFPVSLVSLGRLVPRDMHNFQGGLPLTADDFSDIILHGSRVSIDDPGAAIQVSHPRAHNSIFVVSPPTGLADASGAPNSTLVTGPAPCAPAPVRVFDPSHTREKTAPQLPPSLKSSHPPFRRCAPAMPAPTRVWLQRAATTRIAAAAVPVPHTAVFVPSATMPRPLLAALLSAALAARIAPVATQYLPPSPLPSLPPPL